MKGSTPIGNADINKEWFESKTYLNAFEDPDLANPSLTPDALEAQKKIITAFGHDMFGAFLSENSGGEEIWLNFISAFRPHSLQVYRKGLTSKWYQLLRFHGVHVDSGQENSRAESLMRLLFREST